MKIFLSFLIALLAGAGCSSSGDSVPSPTPTPAPVPVPALVYDTGGKNDMGFNESANRGAQRFRKETGVAYREVEIKGPEEYEEAVRGAAEAGNSPVAAIGFAYADAVRKVAKEYPGTNFAIIDASVDLPNVLSVSFKEHEGSFLVGALAAMASRSAEISMTSGTGKLGFVGGAYVPLIQRFACGYSQGAKHVSSGIEIIENYTDPTGKDPAAAWNNPEGGARLAAEQFDAGADVIFAAAGGSGIGVLKTAADRKKLAIGVDRNQNHLYPGFVLTSMVKHVDEAVYMIFKDAHEKKWKSGERRLGLAENGVGWSLDENNAALVTSGMKARAVQIAEDIISGAVTVHDFTTNGRCGP